MYHLSNNNQEQIKSFIVLHEGEEKVSITKLHIHSRRVSKIYQFMKYFINNKMGIDYSTIATSFKDSETGKTDYCVSIENGQKILDFLNNRKDKNPRKPSEKKQPIPSKAALKMLNNKDQFLDNLSFLPTIDFSAYDRDIDCWSLDSAAKILNMKDRITFEDRLKSAGFGFYEKNHTSNDWALVPNSKALLNGYVQISSSERREILLTKKGLMLLKAYIEMQKVFKDLSNVSSMYGDIEDEVLDNGKESPRQKFVEISKNIRNVNPRTKWDNEPQLQNNIVTMMCGLHGEEELDEDQALCG